MRHIAVNRGLVSAICTRQMLVLGTLVLSAACSQIGVDAEEPAAIELVPLLAPAVVIGDSLRDADGVATPVHAIVRNIRGDIISDAPVTYVYADFNRDSALTVDPTTGYVVATSQPKGEARIAARVGGALQVIRTVAVTSRPDSMDREGQPAITTLVTTIPDTNRTSADLNTSGPLSVRIRHIVADTTTPVASWIVRYTLVRPPNSTNDSTSAVFLVNDNGRASVVDTTDAAGVASRRIRVRAAQFPASVPTDSVFVDVSASYHGVELRGSPVRLVVPINRGSGP